MRAKTAKLRRMQIDRQFVAEVKKNPLVPKKGWIHEVRTALGMSMSDLGDRLGVIKQRIENLEKGEVSGRVTLQSLENAAEALDCDFVYSFVPRRGLQKTLEAQAKKVAQKIITDTEHSMELEQQSTSALAQKHLLEEITRELIRKEDRRIWKTEKSKKR
jgi:predicted DNA-binding mobile mystery protein A